MRALVILLVLLAGCSSVGPQFAAYTDERQMVVFVFEDGQVRHSVIPHDPENAPACRVVTGPVSELDLLMLAQGRNQ